MKGQGVYKIGSLAEKAGITPNLLRAWEKRYQLFAPRRGGGGQRLYGERDLRLLLLVREKINRGLRIGEIAAIGRDALLQEVESGGGESLESPGVAPEVLGGMGTVPYTDYVEAIVRAAVEVRIETLRIALSRVKLECNLDQLVFQVLVPAMERIGGLFLVGKVSIGGEHMVSSIVEQSILNAIDEAGFGSKAAGSPEICCCLPGEEHRIGLLCVAYTLARRGRNVVLLGNTMPMHGLEQSIRQLRPSGIWLSVTSRQIYRRYRKEIARLAEKSDSTIVLGGPGVPQQDGLLTAGGCVLCPEPCTLPDAVFSRLGDKL
jgi:DNA-binding transcriptional MerR regulator